MIVKIKYLFVFFLASSFIFSYGVVRGFGLFPRWIENHLLRLSKPTIMLVFTFTTSTILNPPYAHSLDVPQESQSFGLVDGRLLKCERRSNCVSTSSVNLFEKYSKPWYFTQNPEDMYVKLKEILSKDPYLKLVESDGVKHYLHAEAKSAVPPTGTDDLEFLIKDSDHLITYRSNSREIISVGDEVLSDGGSNRNRLRAIQGKIGVQEMNNNNEIDSYMKEVKQRNIFQILQKASEPNEVNFLD